MERQTGSALAGGVGFSLIAKMPLLKWLIFVTHISEVSGDLWGEIIQLYLLMRSFALPLIPSP